MSLKDWLIGMVVCVLVIIVVMVVLGSFETQYKGLEGEYCIQTGGQWNFYECYENPPVSYCFNVKIGYWCDYPDGTSKSVSQIGYLINSTV